MKDSRHQTYRTFFILMMLPLLLWSCKSSEEIIEVTEDPFAAAPESDFESPALRESTSTDFIQLRIGHASPIRTLDPLFAYSEAEWTTLQFIYEGLTRLNEDDEVLPSLARSWTVNEDSTSYTFTLRSDVYYQDSDAFASGIGRKIVAADVVYAFRRMTDIEVPDVTARKFFNIRGLESFFLEQHYVHIPSERALDRIDGIIVENDSTVTFELIRPDSEFPEKLAAPWASIYPRETVTEEMIIEKYVGTGPFRFIRDEGSSHIILGRNPDYYAANPLNRLDVYHALSEADLFQMMAKEEIDMIPLMSPEVGKTVLNQDLSLNPAYSNRFTLIDNGSEISFHIYFNEESTLDPAALAGALQRNGAFADSPYDIILHQEADSMAYFDATVYTTVTQNPFVRHIYRQIQRALRAEGQGLKLANIRIPFPTISLYSSDFPYRSAEPFITIKSPVFYLLNRNMSGLKLNSRSWWMDVSEIRFQ
jgi:ABC-type transport system substrate-binding protein